MTTYDHLLWEWDTGIVYSDGLKRTVPMAQLEQDKAEGKQVEGFAYEVWRVWQKRKHIYHRKIIIYSMLGAHHQGQDVDDFMQEYHRTAQDVITDRQGKRGPKPCYMTGLLNALIEPCEEQWGSPVEFEQKVLKWKLTASIVAQAAGKRNCSKK